MSRVRALAPGLVAFFLIQGFDPGPAHAAVEGIENITAAEALERFTRELKPTDEPYVGGHEQLLMMRGRLNSGGRQSMALIAEPGVGKTAIARALAGDVARDGRSIFALDLEALKAGSGIEGTFEHRLLMALDNFVGHPDKVLFIDEAHRLVEYPKFLNRLKTVTDSHGTAVILATTPTEHTKFLGSDEAINRRFKPMSIDLPTEDKIVDILEANRARYERIHGVTIEHTALETIARSVLQYYPHVPALSKADDLMNEIMSIEAMERKDGSLATQRARTEAQSAQIRLDGLRTDLRRAGADAPGRPYLMTRIQAANLRLEQTGQKLASLLAIDQVRQRRNEVSKLEAERRSAEQARDLPREAKLRNFLLPKLKDRPDVKISVEAPIASFAESITSAAVAEYVGRDLGMTAEFISESNARKIMRIQGILNERVAGQDHAKQVILSAIKKTLYATEPLVGPRAVILLDGSEGTGKTELAKALAYALFGNLDRLVRIDLSQIDRYNASSLKGVSPGFQNADEGGMMEPLRKNPRSVVLLDELNKTVRSIVDIFHRPFEEGRLDDARGRKIDFRQAFVVATANYVETHPDKFTDNRAIETHYGFETDSLENLTGEALKDRVLEFAMKKKNVSKSMYARFRTVILMDSVTPEMAREIARIKLKQLANHFAAEKGWVVDFDPQVADLIAHRYFRDDRGAREINKGIDEHLSKKIAEVLYKFDVHNEEHPDVAQKISVEPGMELYLGVESDAATDDRGAAHKIVVTFRDPRADIARTYDETILTEAAADPKAKIGETDAAQAGRPRDPRGANVIPFERFKLTKGPAR